MPHTALQLERSSGGAIQPLRFIEHSMSMREAQLLQERTDSTFVFVYLQIHPWQQGTLDIQKLGLPTPLRHRVAQRRDLAEYVEDNIRVVGGARLGSRVERRDVCS